MKLITIKKALTDIYSQLDKEILTKESRPVVLIVRLKYKSAKYDFAVPLRSNIAPAVPKNEYFALPNRPNTKPYHHHGLHYIKMFPVSKQFYELYHIEGNVSAKLNLAFIDKYEKQIVSECQEYLNRFSVGICPPFSTNIDILIDALRKLTK